MVFHCVSYTRGVHVFSSIVAAWFSRKQTIASHAIALAISALLRRFMAARLASLRTPRSQWLEPKVRSPELLAAKCVLCTYQSCSQCILAVPLSAKRLLGR